MLIIEIPIIELTGGHIEIILIIEIAKLELTAGHIEIIQNYRDSQIIINRLPL